MLRELEDGLNDIAEGEVRALWERVEKGVLGEEEAREEEEEAKATVKRKVEELYSIFAVADPSNMQRRVRTSPLAPLTVPLS